MGAASMFLKNKVRWKIPTLYSLPLIASIFALIIFGYKFEQMISFLIGHDWKFGGGFYAPVFMALILVTTLSDNLFTKILSLKLPVLLGEASYALYILEFPMYKLFYNLIRPLLPSGAPDLIVYLVFLTMASIISFYCLEKPVKRLGQNLLNRT
jgi:peptidoglycan/LPS O-acetylase OafA/YrhL